MDLEALAHRIESTPARGLRRLVALCGPPASGKSTLATDLSAHIAQSNIVPMDGFHLDNRVLRARGLLDRKGAPDSFDAAGFKHLVARLAQEAEVVYPVFDRASDTAIAGAGFIDAATTTVIIEGNYLLLDAPVWQELAAFWDLSVYLDVSEPVLRTRLLARWLDHGLSQETAIQKTDGNDLPNAVYVTQNLIPPDIRLHNSTL